MLNTVSPFGPMATSQLILLNQPSNWVQDLSLVASKRIGHLASTSGDVTDYVTAVLKMEPKHCLALCDEARQMAKNILKRVTKGLSTSETQAQPTKAPG